MDTTGVEHTQVFRKKPTPRFEVPLVMTLVIGTLLAVAFVAVVSVIPSGWTVSPDGELAAVLGDLRAKVLDRGPVQVAIVVLFWWSVAFCLQKATQVYGLTTSGFRRLEEVSIPRKITPENAWEVIQLVGFTGNLPFDFRMRRGLQIIADQKDPQAAASFLASQSSADEESAFRSYAFLRFSMWAMPILGFIGTVVGISGGVGSFSASLQQPGQFETVQRSLTGVTSGLTTAFDTTLAGLVGTTIITLIYTLMLRREQTVLGHVDSVLRREIAARFTAPEEQEAEAMAELARSVKEWVKTPAISEEQVRRAIEQSIREGADAFGAIGAAIEKASGTIAEAIEDRFRQSLEQLQTEHRKLTERLMESAGQSMQKIVDSQAAGLAMHLARMKDLSTQTQQLIDLQAEAVARISSAERTQLEDVQAVHRSLQAVYPLVAGLSQGFRLAPMPAANPSDPASDARQPDTTSYNEAHILDGVDDISPAREARGTPLDLNADFGETGPRMSASDLASPQAPDDPALAGTLDALETYDAEPLDAVPLDPEAAHEAVAADTRLQDAGSDTGWTEDGGNETWGDSVEIWNDSAADRVFGDDSGATGVAEAAADPADDDDRGDDDSPSTVVAPAESAEMVPDSDPVPDPDPDAVDPLPDGNGSGPRSGPLENSSDIG